MGAGLFGSDEPAVEGGAVFSRCGRYRWWLWRGWEPGRPRLLFFGLNPSRADGRHNDPTLLRLCHYARRWGFGSVEVLNLFAWVAPQPQLLRRASEPVGWENDRWILRGLAELSPGTVLWLGWGNGGAWQCRDRWLLRQLQDHRCQAFALARTAQGQPRHPLYCSAAMTLQPFAWPLEA